MLVWMEPRVELFALIRRDARIEGLSVRALAGKDKVYCLSAQHSCADWRPIPTARPISVQNVPATFAAATVLSSRLPAGVYSRAAIQRCDVGFPLVADRAAETAAAGGVALSHGGPR